MRRPSERLAGVCWLARFVDKARQILDGTLPKEYAERFCDRRGMDGAFLRRFGITKEGLMHAVRDSKNDDELVAKWFLAQPGVTAQKIQEWNRDAPLFGKPGHPGHEVFQWAMKHVYADAPYTGVESVFEVIDADEARERT